MANFVLIAHAIIPHHHHNTQLCLAQSHCVESHSENQKTNSEDHDHDATGHCILSQMMLVSANQDRQDQKICDTPNNLLQKVLIQVTDISSVLRFSYKPEQKANTIDGWFANNTIQYSGLRGPPQV